MFNWKLAFAPNENCKNCKVSTINDIEKYGFKTIPATVPGNFELDMMREKLIPDLYYSENTLKAQELENLHLWYFAEFYAEDEDSSLIFEGIDTIAEIYINGVFEKATDNMFISYEVGGNIKQGKNEIVVHILPVCIEARKYDIPSGCFAQKHNFASLNIRKAAHMFGWDIMPRIVSGGIWKPVSLQRNKKEKIKDVYFATHSIDYENNSANMRFAFNGELARDFTTDYSVRIYGACGDSSFDITMPVWNSGFQFNFKIDNVKLWMPKNYGEPYLYTTTAELIYKGEVVDSVNQRLGVRVVELEMTDSEKDGEVGKFGFKINGKDIFVLGTNWVPLDAFHSKDNERLDEALRLVDDIGCNALRCWGGNVYESDEFFEFCDARGIMVWQDFGMACGVYPRTGEFLGRLEEEAVYQIKRLRNHPSLILWSGDNECDMVCARVPGGLENDPNNNYITRTMLKDITRLYDYARPYLPSSPYISEKSFAENLPLPEDHLWGPRDYFKGDYYKNATSRFVSETGYQGMPSPKSLRKFLKTPETLFRDNGLPTYEYTVHCASPELDERSPYIYRIRLTHNQIVTLFGSACECFDDLVKQSQISQAEADKYFIERLRIKKGYASGVIWWNILDGWPQVSDAVVDYYFCKKLAYHYIKRSQEPVCLMFDEPQDNAITLYAVNDLGEDAKIEYKIRELYTSREVASGTVVAKAEKSEACAKIEIKDDYRGFYLIEWLCNGKEYKNHYCSNIKNTDYEKYMAAIKECGFDEFEGFI